MDNNKSLIPLTEAVEAIKTAILQGQYEALKDVNRVQLAVYFAIGKYLSNNNKWFAYGARTIALICEQLHKEMPGLRGFSKSNLYEMRKFYDAWHILDSDFPVTIGKSEETYQNSTETNFPVATGKFQSIDNLINLKLNNL